MKHEVPDTPTSLNASSGDECSLGVSPSTTREKLKSSRSSSKLSDADEESDRNTSKKRRSSWSLSGMKSILQDIFPELEAEEKKPQPRKFRSKRSRKFSFASHEEYIEYARASRRSLVSSEEFKKSSEEFKKSSREFKTKEPITKEKEKKDKRDRVSKEPANRNTKNPSWARNWKKHHNSSRKFSFASPEEYLEYSSELKKAKKRNTQSTEFETLDATADVSLFSNPRDDDELDGEESVDLEANNAADDTDNEEDDEKGCFKRKLSIREVVQILGLWVLIAVIALVIARDDPDAIQSLSTANMTDIFTTCLCPSGSSMHQPELEVVLDDEFTCASVELTTSSVYTCAEIDDLFSESTFECDEKDSCPGLQEVANQCCFLDIDETIKKELIQTENAVEYLQLGN